MKPSPRNSVPGEFQQTVKFFDSIIALCQETQGQYQVGLRTITTTVCYLLLLGPAYRLYSLLQEGNQSCCRGGANSSSVPTEHLQMWGRRATASG